MKKVLVIVIVILLLPLATIWLLIPPSLSVTESAIISMPEKACMRTLLNEKSWHKWWPSQLVNLTSTGFVYKDYNYKIQQEIYEGAALSITNDKISYPATIRLISLGADSTVLQLSTVIKTGRNPFTKVKKYFEARRLKNNLDAVIQAYNVFTQKPGNMYGIKIGQEKVKDTLLVSAKIITTKYPSEEEVYNLINKVKKYIQDNGGKETNYPMLHVEAVPAGNVFETMVAIPTDKPLEGNDDIKPKRMVAGKILVAEIKGGISNIEDGFRLMETYMDDHKKVSPAIPFQSLVTDRLKEPDTTKWLTKIYYPIF